MRKTCPIVIPDQNQPKDTNQRSTIHQTLTINNESHANDQATIENNVNYYFDDTTAPQMAVATTSNGYLFATNENNEMPSTSNPQMEHFHHHNNNSYDRTNQLPELSSLNNEFLTTILTTQNYPLPTMLNVYSSPSHSDHLTDSNYVNIDEDLIRPPQYDDTRPRQLGRRSEMRSRIVSITAERNAEGNQVNIRLDIILSRLICRELENEENETENIL